MRLKSTIAGVLFISPVILCAFPEEVDFRRDIQPILEKSCVRCHGGERAKGGLRMDTHERIMEGGDTTAAIVPGNPQASELLVRIHLRPIDQGVMPDEGRALEPVEVAMLNAWVKAGAKWPEGVTLTERKPDPVKRVSLPETAPATPVEAAAMIDDILRRENLDSDNVTTPTVTDSAFLRRATIDLIGRIPTMEEIRDYEAWGDERRAKLVEKLLNHPRFADRWTVFFADMLRVRSDVPGGNQLLAYLNGSVRDGQPYDALVRDLISASGRPNSNPAVGYILGDDAIPLELAAATSQVFLGVRMGCAMCHDHPFDDWRQKQFYSLAAFFGKTKKVQRDNRLVYTTEGDTMTVLWPPEDQAVGKERRPVTPRFPIKLSDTENPPNHIRRFEVHRAEREQAGKSASGAAELDALLDSVDLTPGRQRDAVLSEAEMDSKRLDVHGDIYRTSALRSQLAELVTSPRNDFFARAFVNRVWAELLGRGFVEPLDNFSPYVDLTHASTLDFLSQEFIANGYDLRALVRMIVLTEAYSRSPAPADLAITRREASERNFSAAPVRRMLGEALYDSINVAGHLLDYKWPAGANNREITREIRIPTGKTSAADTAMAPSITTPAMRADGYDLESSLQLDFTKLASAQDTAEIEAMRQKSNQQIEAERTAAMMKETQSRTMQYTLEKVVETIDDNPRFDSSMRMASPAPPAHFLRVFGQPNRIGLGEFRDPSSSMRQQLMMLNGRMTHEASRVGPFEPIHAILKKDPDRAITHAYLEILTRLPTDAETTEAKAILGTDPFQGMADLRWALLNSNEFRFIP
ncbi:MAG: DUF1553 domain-containing protein [Akkermansiaceae bacterium]